MQTDAAMQHLFRAGVRLGMKELKICNPRIYGHACFTNRKIPEQIAKDCEETGGCSRHATRFASVS